MVQAVAAVLAGVLLDITLPDIMAFVADILALPSIAITLTLVVGTYAASRIIGLVRGRR